MSVSDWLISLGVGKPEQVNEWQRQGVFNVLNNEIKKDTLYTELSEIYFSFVMSRIRLEEEFKKEGPRALKTVSRLVVYKAYSDGFKDFRVDSGYKDYKKHPLFGEITEAIEARYHYFSLAQKNRILSFEMLKQFHVPLQSGVYKAKRGCKPLELRMFLKHASDSIFEECVPSIVIRYPGIHIHTVQKKYQITIKEYSERRSKYIKERTNTYRASCRVGIFASI